MCSLIVLPSQTTYSAD